MEDIEIASNIIKENLLLISVSGDITNNFTTRIISELAKYSPDQKRKFVFMLSSQGGYVGQTTKFYEIFKPMGLIGFIGICSLSSSALALAMKLRSNGISFYIDPMCEIILHKCMSISNEGRPDQIREHTKNHVDFISNAFDSINKPLLDLLTPLQLTQYNAGNNVYLMGKNLIKLGIAFEFKNFSPFNTTLKKVKNNIINLQSNS